MALLGLWSCSGFFSSCGEWGLLWSSCEQASHRGGFSCCTGLQGAGASVVVRCSLSSCISWALKHRFSSCAHRLSCSLACGNFPDQGSNSCFPHWQAPSSPLRESSPRSSLSFLQQGIPELNKLSPSAGNFFFLELARAVYLGCSETLLRWEIGSHACSICLFKKHQILRLVLVL